MIARAPLTFLAATLIFWGCTLKDELRTINNDQNDTPVSTQGASVKPEIVVELSDSAVEELAAGQLSVPQGYELDRVFPEDPEFEERHRAAGLHRLFFVKNTEDVPLTRAEGELASIPGVIQLEYIPRTAPDAIPFNDPYAYRQWHLYNDGTLLNKFVAGIDLNVVPVWNEFTAGSNDVIVGVVDTGIDYNHPDLKSILIPAGPNGSKSFLSSAYMDPYTITPQRHATHVAGIIGAINNNGIGVCGVAGGKNGQGGVRIMDCQAIATSNSGDSGNPAGAIVWAADHGAVIVNNSWNLSYNNESDVPSTTPYTYQVAIDYFINNAGTDGNGTQTGPMKGGMVFFSAGNNKGWSKAQPTMYERNMSIGAIGPSGEATTYTNRGDWVDLCAPGGDGGSIYGSSTEAINYPQIFSTVRSYEESYVQMQGTSQACPCASGVAALIVSYFGGPGFTPERLREILINGADREVMKKHTKYIGPMVDAYGSFLYAANTPLTPQKDITGAQSQDNTLVIRWTMNKYGNQNYYKNILALSDDKSKLENLDPFNLPSGITTRIIDGKSVANGMVVSEEFTGIEFYKDWYFTVVSYTRNHLYTTGNTIGKIRLRHNSEPEIQNNIISKIYLDHNSSRVFTLHYSDPDGDALTVTTDPGSSAGSWHDDGGGTLTFSVNGNGAPAGSYTASVMVSDGVATVSSYIYYTLLPNNNPVFQMDGAILAPVKYRETAMLRVRCTDADGDVLNVSTVPGSPAATWTDEGAGVYRLDVRGDSAPAGTYTASISASDNYGGNASHSVEYTLVGNTAPVLANTIPDMVVVTGATTELDLKDYFSDGENDQLQFSVVSASKPLSASVEGSVLSFSAASAGVGEICVSASDGIAAPAESSFKVSAHAKSTILAEVYPTTVTDKLCIMGVSSDKVKMQIIASSGRVVYTAGITSTPFKPHVINVSGLAPGRYTVILSGNKGSSKTTIVKI